MTVTHFADVYRHMMWADARIWQTILASASAPLDDEVMDTVLHLHETQHAFLGAWTGKPLARHKRSEFSSAADLCAWAGGVYPMLFDHLLTLSDAELEQPLVLPWAKYFGRSIGTTPAETTLCETMHQLGSHSMHHRGQIAHRLRELGESPPMTDYIGWVWAGRAGVVWPG